MTVRRARRSGCGRTSCHSLVAAGQQVVLDGVMDVRAVLEVEDRGDRRETDRAGWAGVRAGGTPAHAVERVGDHGLLALVVAAVDQPTASGEKGPAADAGVDVYGRAGLDLVLVTGDNEPAARRVAAQVGIKDVRAGVRPEATAAIVRELQADGTRVAMVGDGINDAPALMQADVGIAVGGGTDIAVESADIVLLRHEVGAVLDARRISDRAYRRTRANMALAFTFNVVGIPLAATGLVYPVWAMVAMAASVTTIFLNSIGSRPSLLFQAISSVGRRPAQAH